MPGSTVKYPIEFREKEGPTSTYGGWYVPLPDNEYFDLEILQNGGAVHWSFAVTNAELAEAITRIDGGVVNAILGTPPPTPEQHFVRVDVPKSSGRTDADALREMLGRNEIVWAKISLSASDFIGLNRWYVNGSYSRLPESLSVYGSFGFDGDDPKRMFGEYSESGEAISPGIVSELLAATGTATVIANAAELMNGARERMARIVEIGAVSRGDAGSLGSPQHFAQG